MAAAAVSDDAESVLSSLSSEAEEQEQPEEQLEENEGEDGMESGDEEEEDSNAEGAGTPAEQQRRMASLQQQSQPHFQQQQQQPRRGGGGGAAGRRKAAHSSLAVPAKRRLSFDDGSDLSALTSDNENEIAGDADDLDSESENESEEPASVVDDDDEKDMDQDAQEAADGAGPAIASGQSPGMSTATEDAVASMLSAAATSDPAAAPGMDAVAVAGSTSMRPSTSSSSASSSNTTKRGKGRPPRKQNAIAAAAKRQVQKKAKADARRAARQAAGPGANDNDDDDIDDDDEDELLDVENSTEGEEDAYARYNNDNDRGGSLIGDGETTRPTPGSTSRRARSKQATSMSPANKPRLHRYASSSSADEADPRQSAPSRSLLSHAHRDLQIGSGTPRTDGEEEEDDITSEAERLRAPLPPFPDDSADEDYHEKPKSASLARSRGRKQPRGTIKPETSSPKRSPQSRKRMLERQAGDSQSLASGHELSDTGSEALQDGKARIVVTDANGRPTVGQSGHMASLAAQHAPAQAAEADDAMSGVSEDIPILLQATAKAVAGTSRDDTAIVVNAGSLAGTPDPGKLEDGHFASMTGQKKDMTPEMDAESGRETLATHLPIPNASSRGRAKSPSGVTGRGRGRGLARGRGKHRNLHRAFDQHEDPDAAISGAEGAATSGEREGTPPLETPVTSDVEDEPADSTAAKKRAEAIEALTKIEIEFAQIRDLLYLEKMDEIARERWQVEAGVHPELVQLMQMIEYRRKAKLDLANKVLAESEVSSIRCSEAGHRAVWYDWIDERYDLRRALADEANTKRRRLDREKRAIERPKSEDLLTILRVHAPPPHAYYERKPVSAYGADYSLEYEVAEALQKKRKRGATGLDQDEALYDMERMGLRDPYRGTYPPQMAYDPAYAPVPTHVALPFGYDYPGPFAGGTQHPLAAQGRTVASVHHANNGRADPFSAYRVPNATAHPVGAASQYPPLPANGRSGAIHRPTLDDHLAAVPPGAPGRTGLPPKYSNGMQGRISHAYFPVGYAGV